MSVVFVGGLNGQVTEEILRGAFLPFGEITKVTYNKSKGFGLVEYEQKEDAQEAIFNMDQSEMFGQTIQVKFNIKH